jgi:cytochrome c oxidase assembly protein subunit 15
MDKYVLRWLIAICVIITVMVSIGGITRLTGSGLSITDWKPIMGAIPPLSEADWQETFARYQATPQYLKVTDGMPLSEFKFIFFWEYFHRLVGRSIGLVILFPMFFFWRKKRIDLKLIKKVMIGFALGGLQGAMGWFMVMSGLIDQPSVSHYRLSAHLLLALLILSYFTWIACDYSWANKTKSHVQTPPSLKQNFRILKLLILLQILYGAFVAGLKAGLAFNTFPKMAGEWIPGNLFALTPSWINPLENPATVQWIHRWLGTLVLIGVVLFALQVKKTPGLEITKRWSQGLKHMIYVQFLMGIFTLLFQVPLVLGVLHQLGAALVIILVTGLSHSLKKESKATP